MNRHNNWMTCSFRDGGHFKSHPADPMILHFRPTPHDRNMSYRDALYYNARKVADNFAGPFDVFLSGGIDSEVIVRVNHDLGIKQKLYTIRLEDDLNARDVASAQHIAQQLGQKLHIIDFNAQRWLEKHGQDYYHKTKVPLAGNLIRIGWLGLTDNIQVMGYGEPYWFRIEKGNYSKQSQWLFHWIESAFSLELYAAQNNFVALPNWNLYTPEIVMSFHKNKIITELLQDRIYGKQSSWSSRDAVHQEIWPHIRNKPKLTGYETDGAPGTMPKFIQDFQDTIMAGVTNTSCRYTQAELEKLLD